jgi:UDP:flavonoid glycosyltransferase YjiC (YdhE family)
LLAPFVAAGDVHPLLGLGIVLRQRGHQVTVATNDQFAPLVAQLGLEFVSTGTVDEYLAITRDPNLARPLNAVRVGFARSVIPLTHRLYQIIEHWYQPGQSVVAAAGLALGARVAQEKLGVPLATIHLQPASFRSLDQGSKLPFLVLPDWFPRRVKAAVYRALDRGADRNLLAVNQFRAALGLPPAERMLSVWWNSPRRVLGLFPDWYAAPQPDWPPQAVFTGFPLFDGGLDAALPDGLEAFLAEGEPPIVFSQGSLMRYAAPYFRASIEACRRLNRRGILLTPFAEQLPHTLPATIRHYGYVPLSWLLVRAAALVHHGGIGTTALALAAGIPQLLVPRMHDHPDNARRLERLGVGAKVRPGNYRASSVAAALGRLLSDAEVQRRLQDLSARICPQSARARAADEIELLATTEYR